MSSRSDSQAACCSAKEDTGISAGDHWAGTANSVPPPCVCHIWQKAVFVQQLVHVGQFLLSLSCQKLQQSSACLICHSVLLSLIKNNTAGFLYRIVCFVQFEQPGVLWSFCCNSRPQNKRMCRVSKSFLLAKNTPKLLIRTDFLLHGEWAATSDILALRRPLWGRRLRRQTLWSRSRSLYQHRLQERIKTLARGSYPFGMRDVFI